MCVAAFRDYCNASRFQIDHDNQQNFNKDLENPDAQIRGGSYTNYVDEKGNIYQSTYYVTDLRKMRTLAENGNPYAVAHLKGEDYV